MLLTRPSREIGYHIQADAFDRVETLKGRKSLNNANFGGHKPYRKGNIVLAPGTRELTFYFRYKNTKLKIYYKNDRSVKPVLFKEVNLQFPWIFYSLTISKFNFKFLT